MECMRWDGMNAQDFFEPSPLRLPGSLLLDQGLASFPPCLLMLALGFDEVLDASGKVLVLACEVHYVFEG